MPFFIFNNNNMKEKKGVAFQNAKVNMPQNRSQFDAFNFIIFETIMFV